MKKLLFICMLLGSIDTAFAAAGFQGGNMLDWVAQCRSLETNLSRLRAVSTRDSAFGNRKATAFNTFDSNLGYCMEIMRKQLSRLKKVEAGAFPLSEINVLAAEGYPFAQKLDLPEEAQVVFHGDLHGDVHSLMNELVDLYNRGYINEDFKIIKENLFMVFLGDYVDRGCHGAEVVYTLLCLKVANPDKVFMVRGNHEDLGVQKRERVNGFSRECQTKFGRGMDVKIAEMYNLMPVVLYVGCGNNYLQCCHGGMEPGYNPTVLLNSEGNLQFLGELKRGGCIQEGEEYKSFDLRSTPGDRLWNSFTPRAANGGFVSSHQIGFMWHDFNVEREDDLVTKSAHGRGMTFAKLAVENLIDLQNHESDKKVRGVFRAHQHSGEFNPMMRGLVESRGVYKLWNDFETDLYPALRSISDGLVWTFNVGADSVYGKACNFTFDAFGILTVANDYEEWGLQVINTDFTDPLVPVTPEKPAEVKDGVDAHERKGLSSEADAIIEELFSGEDASFGGGVAASADELSAH